MARAFDGTGSNDGGKDTKIKNKYDDPNYYGYTQLLYEKANDEIIDKIIKRLKLTDKKKKESKSPTLSEVRKFAQLLQNKREKSWNDEDTNTVDLRSSLDSISDRQTRNKRRLQNNKLTATCSN